MGWSSKVSNKVSDDEKRAPGCLAYTYIYIRVVATQIIFYFHPEILGGRFIQFDGCIFFKWVGENPPTRQGFLFPQKKGEVKFWCWPKSSHASASGTSTTPPPPKKAISFQSWKSFCRPFKRQSSPGVDWNYKFPWNLYHPLQMANG